MSEIECLFMIAAIIVNGILVYFFQYYVSLNIKKKVRLRHNRYKLLSELHQQLINLYDNCRSFSDSLYAKYDNNVANSFNQEMTSFKQFKVFYLLHKNILKEYESTIELICNEVEDVHREMCRIQTDYDGKISSETIVSVAEHHNKLVIILDQAIDMCCRDLSKVYA